MVRMSARGASDLTKVRWGTRRIKGLNSSFAVFICIFLSDTQALILSGTLLAGVTVITPRQILSIECVSVHPRDKIGGVMEDTGREAARARNVDLDIRLLKNSNRLYQVRAKFIEWNDRPS